MIKLNSSKQMLKYRTKFIQEHHYNKSEQRQLDEAVVQLNISYKELYFNVRRGERYLFMATITCNRVAGQFSKLGVTVATATAAIANFGASLNDTLKRYAEYEKEKNLERLKEQIINLER